MSDLFAIPRRRVLPAGAAAAALLASARPVRADVAEGVGACTTVPQAPVAKRPSPQVNALDLSRAEVELAFRNRGMFNELLRLPFTPLGAHYVLTHFDVPTLNANDYTLAVGGLVSNPARISLDTIKSLSQVDQAVTMECAGTGRASLQPRPVYVPWTDTDVGTFQWTGTPLAPILKQAGLLDGAVEVLFTGWDRGVDLGVEHAYERSLPIEDALRPEVMLAWAANGQPLPPEHGYPLRLIVPSWYGMASVKWLRAITVLGEPFQGVQQAQVYRYQTGPDDPGLPVREKRVMSLLSPPGIPDLLSRWRFIPPGPVTLQGVAWSGGGQVTGVEFTTDGGSTWQSTDIESISSDPYAWVRWSTTWQASEGTYKLGCRATDASGATQPLDPQSIWNYQGNAINAVKWVGAVVQAGTMTAEDQVPSRPRQVLSGAKVPPAPATTNQAVNPSRRLR